MKKPIDVSFISPKNEEEQQLLNDLQALDVQPYIATMGNPCRWYDWIPIHYNFFVCFAFLFCTSILKFDKNICLIGFFVCAMTIGFFAVKKLNGIYLKAFDFYFTSTRKDAYTKSIKSQPYVEKYRFWARLFFCCIESLLIIFVATKIIK